MQQSNALFSGATLAAGNKVLLMIHGRGASAGDILSLASHLPVSGFSLVAPQAPGGTWYPYSFLAPVEQNQPWLDQSLEVLNDALRDVVAAGVPPEDVYLLGFSQGACLALEFTARNAQRFGGVIALTGGLIGQALVPVNYPGDFKGTPVFIGSGDPDPHVPASRVRESAAQLRSMNALVKEQIYPGMPHTVTDAELKAAAEHVFKAR